MPKKSARTPRKAASKQKAQSPRAVLPEIHTARHSHVLDACDLKLTAADATPDEDLPVAEGGVA